MPKGIGLGRDRAGLRATGVDFDLRKARPYMGYENFEFEVPVFYNGDAYDRCMVKIEEMSIASHHSSMLGRMRQDHIKQTIHFGATAQRPHFA